MPHKLANTFQRSPKSVAWVTLQTSRITVREGWARYGKSSIHSNPRAVWMFVWYVWICIFVVSASPGFHGSHLSSLPQDALDEVIVANDVLRRLRNDATRQRRNDATWRFWEFAAIHMLPVLSLEGCSCDFDSSIYLHHKPSQAYASCHLPSMMCMYVHVSEYHGLCNPHRMLQNSWWKALWNLAFPLLVISLALPNPRAQSAPRRQRPILPQSVPQKHSRIAVLDRFIFLLLKS